MSALFSTMFEPNYYPYDPIERSVLSGIWSKHKQDLKDIYIIHGLLS